jgi:transposase
MQLGKETFTEFRFQIHQEEHNQFRSGKEVICRTMGTLSTVAVSLVTLAALYQSAGKYNIDFNY